MQYYKVGYPLNTRKPVKIPKRNANCVRRSASRSEAPRPHGRQKNLNGRKTLCSTCVTADAETYSGLCCLCAAAEATANPAEETAGAEEAAISATLFCFICCSTTAAATITAANNTYHIRRVKRPLFSPKRKEGLFLPRVRCTATPLRRRKRKRFTLRRKDKRARDVRRFTKKFA